MSRLSIWTFSIFCCFLISSGCESSLDWTFDSLPKLTIYAHPAPDNWEKRRIYVYSSLSPQDSSNFVTPPKVEVEITEFGSDLTIKLDSAREGNQVFFEFPEDFELKEGFKYSIKAVAPGFEPVFSTTRIPTPSIVTDLKVKDIDIQPSDINQFKYIVHYTVEFNIEHNPDNHYYHLIFYNQYNGLDNAYFIDPELSDEIPSLHNYDVGILIDKKDLKEGQPLRFNFVDWAVENYGLSKVYVELRSVTDEYYKYQASLARQVLVRQDRFAEPVPIYNNIEGGFGNFSGFSPFVTSSDVPH